MPVDETEFKLKPSEQIWKYFKGDITPLKVCCAVADRLGGYHISYSANELLKDLSLITEKGNPNKRGRKVLAHYLHHKHFKSIWPVVVVNPITGDFIE